MTEQDGGLGTKNVVMAIVIAAFSVALTLV
jgi:hypothetical protein